MTKIRNADLDAALEAIAELRTERLPIDTAVTLRLLDRELRAQKQIVEEVRVEIVKAHGTADESGNYSVAPDSATWPDFVTDFNELMTRPYEVRNTIKRSALTVRENGGRAPLEPRAAVIFGLGEIMVDDNAEAA